jgi:hypothetical protein
MWMLFLGETKSRRDSNHFRIDKHFKSYEIVIINFFMILLSFKNKRLCMELILLILPHNRAHPRAYEYALVHRVTAQTNLKLVRPFIIAHLQILITFKIESAQWMVTCKPCSMIRPLNFKRIAHPAFRRVISPRHSRYFYHIFSLTLYRSDIRPLQLVLK